MRYFLALCCILFAGCTDTREISKIHATTRYSMYDAVLRIEYERQNGTTNTGSAFCIKGDYIITAAHVLQGNGTLRIKNRHYKLVKCDIIKIEIIPGTDAAIISVANLPSYITRLEVGSVKLDYDAKAYGYPFNANYSMRKGKTTNIIISTNCKVSSGMSGGPLLQDGKVVGIISGRTFDRRSGEGSDHLLINTVMEYIKRRK